MDTDFHPVTMKNFFSIITLAVYSITVLLTVGNAQDYFDKDNTKPFLAFKPLNEMYVPLGTTQEGYQFGVKARILSDKDYRTGKITPEVLASKDSIIMYFVAPRKDGSFEMVEVSFNFNSVNFTQLKDKGVGDVIIWDKIEGNQFLWKSYYNQASDDAFIYALKEIRKFEEDAQKEEWDSRENVCYDEYRVSHEEMVNPEACIHLIRSVGEHAMGLKQSKEFLDKLSKAYSEGGRAYLASVTSAPQIRKDILKKNTSSSSIPAPVKKNAKKKDKCVFYIACENEVKILSHGVRVENASTIHDKFLWALKLKNIGGEPQEYYIKIKFYDKGGFMVFETSHHTRKIDTGETASVGDNRLIDKDVWPTIKTVEFEIKRY